MWKVYGSQASRYLEAVRAGEDTDRLECTSAVQGVSFDVEPGETFVVMGLSGSGKSTLVRCLTRLVEPTDGVVDIDGVDVRAMTRRQLSDTRRKDWAMVFQHFGLLPHRRVLQNVAYGLEVGGVGRRERESKAREVIELVGLRGVENKYPHELSGGMKQRVGLARALAVDPRLLLLDEPFSALDPLIRTDLQDQLLRLAKIVKQTSVFITHDLAEALKVGDRIAIMRDGQFVQVGTPEDIVLRPKDDYVRRFALDAPRAKVVTARTAATRATVVGATETIDEARAQLVAEGSTSVVVHGSTPFVISGERLRHVDTGRSLQDLRDGQFAVVSPDAKLWDVMSQMTSTGNAVIVRDDDGVIVGTVDATAVVMGLGVPTADENAA
ncbi:quaternary amine ABC transporter ATP-binding protein [Nocardioides astragali]|uniref:Glycine betaine/L-proline ABC transporter ATP-binding protein n=1 Tax=Nocardioides astragali TaxID=1776736 RepID=A0ABW2NCA5_9ACTN|nr:betaine/proline/choline family ABC transporter ATP-binding protein [Nocardioides astragali]